MVGYSEPELDDAQAKWGLRFPPDLIERLRECRPLIDDRDCFDWVTADPEHIRERLAWPFESYWRSIEINDFWWPEWGERPASQVDQKEKLRGIISAAPKLIPLMGIRYIPDEPYESGNPVFSVMGVDIIHCGANLTDWLERESGGLQGQKPWPPLPLKEIRFWSQAVRYMHDESSVVRRQIAASIAKRNRPERRDKAAGHASARAVMSRCLRAMLTTRLEGHQPVSPRSAKGS
jgi:hypothetical protein